jgi:DNA topoisomerase-2
MVRKKKIEDVYQEMDEITHILSRSGMWVGSTKEETRNTIVYNADEARMEMRDVTYIPAMLKIFDEVLSNSCDEFRRTTNMGLNTINVTVSKNGFISVRDNGGIPVVVHKTAGCYIPEFIFGRLRTSSNYDDTEDRQLVGTNGVGSALANVFSKKFIIDTADKHNIFHRSWSDNMRTLNDDLLVSDNPKKEHYTMTSFYIDFDKFDTSNKEFTDDFICMIQKRCIDAAAANPGLKVNFHTDTIDEAWKFKDFSEYIDLYSAFVNSLNELYYIDKDKEIFIFPGDISINVGFVDGAECSKGTHINAIRSSINSDIRAFLQKKHKIDVTLPSISSHYSLFCLVNVTNPAYNSQTKEELTTPVNKFSKEDGYKFEIKQNFFDATEKSELINIMLDWNKQKETAEDLKAIRKMNRESGKLLRNDKFINCNSSRHKSNQLWIFEGDSAASGFRAARDPQTQAGYLMRGVPLNTEGMKTVEIMKNQVFNDIVKVIGLKWGEYNKVENLKFGKIVIASDMDYDGHKIAALLMVFFNHFPELFEQGIICRIISPIIIATKKKDIKKYYSMDDFHKDESNLKGYTIKYIKGLGGQNAKEYKEMMQSNNFMYFKKDDIADGMMNKWFGKNIASVRKDMLKKEVEA